MLHALFDMLKLDKYIQCMHTNDLFHANGNSRLLEINSLHGSFFCQISQEGLSMIHVILIHAINVAGKLLNKI